MLFTALASVSAVVTQIPVIIEQNQILIPVSVGKSRSLTFLLDTGAEATVIASDRAEEAGLDQGAASTGTAQGGEISTRVHRFVAVRAGKLPLGKMTVAAVDLSGLSAGTGRKIDGILGYEFFHGRVVRIDYAVGVVSVLRKGTGLGRGIPLRVSVRGRT